MKSFLAKYSQTEEARERAVFNAKGGSCQTSGPRLSNVAPTLDLQEPNRSGFEARTKARAELLMPTPRHGHGRRRL